MLNATDFGLKVNPFEHTTPTPSKDMVWAGMHTHKQAITNIYKQAFHQNARQIILNWGPWGGGKTYAAYYFSHNRIASIAQDEQIRSFWVLTPEDGDKAALELLVNIADAIGWNTLKNTIAANTISTGTQQMQMLLYQRTQSSEFAQAIIKLCTDTFTTDGFLLAKYFNGSLDKTEKNKYRIARDVKTTQEKLKVIAAILIAYTQSTLPKRIFIWIDEMENAIFFTSKQVKEYVQVIRDLADMVNERITIFMNVTLAESDEQRVDLLLREALTTRINRRLRFKDFSMEDALIYVQELLQAYQTAPTTNNHFTPFTEEALKQILGTIKPDELVPREINRMLDQVLQFVMKEGKRVVDIAAVRDFLQSQNEF